MGQVQMNIQLIQTDKGDCCILNKIETEIKFHPSYRKLFLLFLSNPSLLYELLNWHIIFNFSLPLTIIFIPLTITTTQLQSILSAILTTDVMIPLKKS